MCAGVGLRVQVCGLGLCMQPYKRTPLYVAAAWAVYQPCDMLLTHALAPSSSQIFSLLRPAEKPKRIRVCLY